ncbi:MAG: YfhL family 4Fe-4S dicluster ferredoxin [Campylobacterales bacterium]|nr:YfhL family 4Fe-4S dicluster ferredoxin [Campylobacterales bacterium]
MSLFISDECIACDACIDECPNEAIDEGDPVYVIDPDICTECVGSYDEPACIAVCPVDAIDVDPDNIETAVELSAKFKNLKNLD